jgi:hypothetical protein
MTKHTFINFKQIISIMKKITFLFLSLLMCLGASAKISTKQLLITGVPLVGEKQVTLSTWADFQLCNKLLSIADYPKVRIVYSGAAGKLFAYIKCTATKQQQNIGVLKDSADVDTTIVFDTAKFGSMDSIYIDIQGQEAPNTFHLKKVAFIAADGTEMSPTYKTGSWGNSVGSYSGVSTLAQWGRMGGASWVPTKWVQGETHEFTIKLNSPIPNGKWYFIYKKPGATTETYINLPMGKTEFTLSLNFDYGTYMNLQSQMASNSLDIASMTRTVYAPVYKDTTSIYTSEYGTDMGEWFGSVIIPAEKFAKAMVYDVISVKISNAKATSKIGFRENTEDLLPLADDVNEVTLTDGAVEFNYTIKDAAVLAKLKKNGVNISGSDVTVKSADLISTDDSYDPNATPTAIKTASNDNADVTETQIFNVAGQQQSTMSKGMNIVRQRLSNGTVKVKKVLVK